MRLQPLNDGAVGDDDGSEPGVARLHGVLSVPASASYELRYGTRTGALLRIDGAAIGAFDREHGDVRTTLDAGDHDVVLDVERSSLPSSGLPAGPGLRWTWLQAMRRETPRRTLDVKPAASEPARDTTEARNDAGARNVLEIIGHAHLDVAWLWTYSETHRKAARTFATAVNLLERHDDYVFTQSQPQLYEWVREDEPALFERVRALAATGRFDASGAAMWVEPDCNLPSGESLLRQLVAGIRYSEAVLGVTPTVAWLPDSFGFANTLPTLLAHACIRFFATTKLRWNDTTQFPHPRFAWEGPDGSRVLSALFASYEGRVTPDRCSLALSRNEPLVVGYSDGGGGPTESIVADGSRHGTWTGLGPWFEQLRASEPSLPVVRDELYLEYHRGVFTTHHDTKSANAALERSLLRAERALAWMTVLRASPYFVDEARRALDVAWSVALRNQFHDVLPGTAIAEVYDDARAEFEHATAAVQRVLHAASTSLPRTAFAALEEVPAKPDGDTFVFNNGYVRARVRSDGTIVELGEPGGPNAVAAANVLAAYVDRPTKWEAWNIDRSYVEKPLEVEVLGSELSGDALFVRYRVGESFAASRISLRAGEPFLRVELAVDWRERQTLLRCENEVVVDGPRARFGSPHGVVERPAAPATPAERAKFEACGQRFGRVDGTVSGEAAGLAVLALDTYGWSVGPGEGGATRLGHSLLRGTSWPDPSADVGEHRIVLGFAPTGGLGNGALEALWERFADEGGVPQMVSCDDPAIAIVATKPADDADGIIIRIRECDGAARDVTLACNARALSANSVDALERPLAGENVALGDGQITLSLPAYGLRSLRVRFA